MRVVRLRAPGGPEQLAVEEADRPQPGPDEALVRVHAAAITRGELEWPVDRLPAIPCYELCGVIEEAGAGVAGIAAGDKVFALTPFDRGGVAADHTALPAELLVPSPRALGDAESAAIPLPALSAWQGLFDHGRLAANERVLIHGASGVVGGFAVQLARARGAHVIGTASGPNLGVVRRLGAHEAIDAATRFEEAGEPVDLVFDTAGGERLRRAAPSSLQSGRPTGRDRVRRRRSCAYTPLRSPVTSWNGRSTACRRSRPTSSPEWSRKSDPASPASRPATRCSR